MKQSPIFTRTYDLLRWLIPATIKFPREQRFVLAEAVQRTALAWQEQGAEWLHLVDLDRAFGTGSNADLLAAHADTACGIPILTQHVRSLNLSSAVAVVVYEALRQIDARP